jgi:Zn-finger nucleic acid-binding protein
MKCPVCSKALVEYKAGAFNVDICRDGCSGIWFDKSEIEKCDEHSEPFPTELLRVNKSPNVVIDRSKAHNCPKCESQVMTRIVLDPEKRFEIDRCPKCEGHWLDNGELERMRKVSQASANSSAQLAAYNKRVNEQLDDVDARFRVGSFIKSLLK